MGIIFGTGLFDIMFLIVFVIVIGTFGATAVRSVSTWNKNNHSPKLTVRATIVSKRMDVRHYHHVNAGDVTGAHGYYGTSATDYFVTFQVESGDRMELETEGYEFGLLVEGDVGNLTFQGTRYLSFERT